MTGAANAKRGDILACDRQGRTFFAVVTKPADANGAIEVTPITKGATYYHVTARDVKAHYKFHKGSPPLVTKTGAPAWGKHA